MDLKLRDAFFSRRRNSRPSAVIRKSEPKCASEAAP
jgi:hypothetical protein